MVSVRNAMADDADAIAGVSVRSWRHAYRGIIDDQYLASLDPVAIAVQVREITQEGIGSVLVAVEPAVLGFSWLSPSRDDDAVDTAEIVALYVDPIAQRRGLGRALLIAHRELAWAQGFRRMTLWVLAENHAAHRFYDACGFAADGRSKTNYQWGATAVREVRYVCAVP